MTDTNLGVIIGGGIGIVASIVPTILAISFEYKKWKKGIRIENLRSKKNKLEQQYKEAIKKMEESIQTNSYSVDTLSDFLVTFPESVGRAFIDMMDDKNKGITQKQIHLITITTWMKSSLNEIDNKIEKILN